MAVSKKPSRKPAPVPRDRIPRVAEPRLRPWMVPVALCVLTFLAYSNSFQAGFAFDNNRLLLGDPRVRDATAENLRLILQHNYWWPWDSSLYRPLTTLSYLFNYALLGNSNQPAGYHWVNLILHMVNVLLVFALARRLVPGYWPPAFIAALWAVHPVLTESVTNIVGRADLMAGTGLLAALVIYTMGGKPEGRGQAWWLIGLALSASVAVFSKESGVALLGAVALYEFTWWKQRKQVAARIWGWLVMLGVVAAMLLLRSMVMAAIKPAAIPFVDNPIVSAGFWTGRLTALAVLGRYLGLMVWPAHLSFDYSYAAVPLAHGSWQDWVAWIAVASLAAGAMALARRNRCLFFFAGFSFLALLPAANLFFPIGTIMAERLLYLSCVGLAVGVVLGAYAVSQRFAPYALCLIVVALAARTWARNQDWQDDLTLSASAIGTTPGSFKAHFLLAHALFESDPSHSNIGRVVEEADRSLAVLDPLPDSLNSPNPYREAALFHFVQGQMAERAAPLEAAADYRKAQQATLRCLSIVKTSENWEDLKKRDPAQYYELAAAMKYPVLYRMLSEVSLKLSDPAGAIASAVSYRDLNPLAADPYRSLASASQAAGRTDDAAVTLWDGFLITSDAGLRQQLSTLYAGNPAFSGCVKFTSNGPDVDPACPPVHRHLCTAAGQAMRISNAAGRHDTALRLQGLASNEFGCNPEPLDQIPGGLPE